MSVGDDVTILSLESQLEEAKQELKTTLTDLNTVTLECNDYKARCYHVVNVYKLLQTKTTHAEKPLMI